MKRRWQLQEAKSRFSEVVKDAMSEGPQLITRHGEEVAVLLSAKEYKTLTRPKGGIVDFFSRSPFAKAGLDLSRPKETARKVDL
jgi:prevent-host-death family protein